MASAAIPVPDPMVLKGDVASNWSYFRKSFVNYSVATGLNERTKAVQMATLWSVLGKRCNHILDHLRMTEAERDDPTSSLNALEAYFKPKVNPVYERYIFGTAVQRSDETVAAYITRLHGLASSCGYAALEEELIRDRIVIGVRDEALRMRLLRIKDLTLDDAVNLCRTTETAAQQFQTISNPEAASFNNPEDASVYFSRPGRGSWSSRRTDRRGEQKKVIKAFKYCGRTHAYDRNACPAYGQTCNKCQGQNHFAKVCTLRTSESPPGLGRWQEA